MTNPTPEFATIELVGEAVDTRKYSPAWWKDTADRVVSTIAQAAIATVTASAIPGVLDIDPLALASVSGLAGLLAFLKALAVTRTPG